MTVQILHFPKCHRLADKLATVISIQSVERRRIAAALRYVNEINQNADAQRYRQGDRK